MRQKRQAIAAAAMTACLIAPPAVLAQSPPATITVRGIVRDFMAREEPGGHIDFEAPLAGDLGLGPRKYCANLVMEDLGPDRKPVYSPGTGILYSQMCKDASNNEISQFLYDSGLGDTDGTLGSPFPNCIDSAASFASWYNDTPGVNLSKVVPITFVQIGGGRYRFDTDGAPPYDTLGGFFPVDDDLLGNYSGYPSHNFHFTFELHMTFVYRFADNQVFDFRGDDDVWVFINDKCVVDLGGRHSPKAQVVDLNRLGLVDGTTYPIDFFSAERHTDGSNLKITTNFEVVEVPPKTISAAFD